MKFTTGNSGSRQIEPLIVVFLIVNFFVFPVSISDIVNYAITGLHSNQVSVIKMAFGIFAI